MWGKKPGEFMQDAENPKEMGAEEILSTEETSGNEVPEVEVKSEESDLPEFVKKRLGRQEKKHQRELQEMQSQLERLKSQVISQQANPNYLPDDSDYAGSNDVVSQIRAALAQEREAQLRQAQQIESQKHQQKIAEHFNRFKGNLENAAEDDDDLYDLINDENAPITSHMRDIAMFIPNSVDVFKKLSKNRDELHRISQLHPLEQAKEIIGLSHALAAKNGNDLANNMLKNPMGNLKERSAQSSNRKNLKDMSVSDLRKMLKR